MRTVVADLLVFAPFSLDLIHSPGSIAQSAAATTAALHSPLGVSPMQSPMQAQAQAQVHDSPMLRAQNTRNAYIQQYNSHGEAKPTKPNQA